MSTVRLGDIARWGSGGTPRRSVHEYFGEGMPWLSIADLTDGPVYEAKESLTPLGIENSSAKVVPAGTLFVAMYGSIGKLGIATREFCTSQAIAFAVPDQERVDTRYLFHFLLAQRPQLESRGRGGTQKNISQGDLKKWEILLPPLPEQKRIAAILDKADALCTERQAALAKLDELTQSIFLEMFGDPIANPKDFPKRQLGDIVKLKSGNFLPASNMTPGGTHPVYGGNGVSGHHSEYMFENPQIVIGRVGAYCGCVHLTPPQSWVTDNALFVSSFDDALNPTYLLHALTYARLNQYASQSGQPLISASRLKPVQILLPPKDLQADFVMRISIVQKLTQALSPHAEKLEALFASLQHRAFSGTL